MSAIVTKKSPRAPTISLRDAIERALKAYDRERLHEAPTEIVAQNIGYKNANSGTALSVIASLRYFGLLTRPKNGYLAVSKDLESMRFAPTDEQRQSLVIQFLMKPDLYVDLLKKYEAGLPSDATMKYDLIQRGFIPAAAETVLSAFKQSVEFANYYGAVSANEDSSESPKVPDPDEANDDIPPPENLIQTRQQSISTNATNHAQENDSEKIPVRLSGGRKAWLLIPGTFYKADKDRLKAQIDLLLAEDEEY